MHESEVAQSCQTLSLQPTRLLHPWDFPGKSTGVGCHCLLRCDEGERVNLSLQSWNLLVSFAIHLTWFQQKWSTIKYLWAERATIKSEWPSEEAGTWTWGDTNVGYWESSRTEPVLISTVIGLPLCEHPGQPHAWWEYQRHSLYLPGLQGVKM